MSNVFRGEVWLVNLDPTPGTEQAGIRPALIISENIFIQGSAEPVKIVPITSQNKGIRSHVKLHQGEGGLNLKGFAKSEEILRMSRRLAKFTKQLNKIFTNLSSLGNNYICQQFFDKTGFV